MKHIPAGISKRTGKPYTEFWACMSNECDFTWRPSKSQGEPKKVIPTFEADVIQRLERIERRIIKLKEELE